jgi:hypothetical protein
MLISETYRKLQEELHRNPSYGMASVEYAPLVAEYVRRHEIRELLDYGAGKGRLGEELEWLVPWKLDVRCYDPGVPRWSTMPSPAKFVACVDVLEHIEPDLIDNVLDDLRRVTAETGLFTIDTTPAMKTLADGRNAHLIQQPAHWWLPRILQRFELLQFSRIRNGFYVVVANAAATAAMTASQSP